MSQLATLTSLPPDPILGITAEFKQDPRPNKVNLCVGAYRNDQGQPIVLDAVREAQHRVLEAQQNIEYLPIDGDSGFCQQSLELTFGAAHPLLQSGRVYAAHTVAGTGALRIAGGLIARLERPVYVSDPTWANHQAIFDAEGLDVRQYPYYDAASHQLNIDAMLAAIGQMPRGAVILLQPCCHNPTGCDPTQAQWAQICEAVAEAGLLPLFDMAYQGLGNGLEADSHAIRLFADRGLEMICTLSCSKNFGLYGERVGSILVVCSDAERAEIAGTQIRSIIRCAYSSPPKHGAAVVRTILEDAQLRSTWESQLDGMRNRLQLMRTGLVEAISAIKPDHSLHHLADRHGMFCLTGLSIEQVNRLRDEHAIYIMGSGRINISGLASDQIEYVANAIAQVLP